MENASKALLMAGGVLMTMIILAMLVLMSNNLTNFFSEDSQANREAQIVKFNEEYESYNRKNIRGTEMLSLLAKVQDYNEYQSDYEGTNVGYLPVTVKITEIESKNIRYNQKDNAKIKESYIQSKDSLAYTNINKIKDDVKTELTKVSGKENITDSDLETLATSLALMESTENLLNYKTNGYSRYEIEQLQKTLSLMQNIFHPKNPNKFNTFTIKGEESKDEINALKVFFTNNYKKIEENTRYYYQYQQFKKSYFDIDGDPIYDKNTGRIIGLNFKYTKTGD